MARTRRPAGRAQRLGAVEADPDRTNPLALLYLNRLSDLLFILARLANPDGDVLWKPGGDRRSDRAATAELVGERAGSVGSSRLLGVGKARHDDFGDLAEHFDLLARQAVNQVSADSRDVPRCRGLERTHSGLSSVSTTTDPRPV